MDTESIAFRALLYRECWRQRYFDPNTYIEHAEENDRQPPPDGKLVLAFINNLTPADWFAVCLMDVADIRPGAFALLAAELSLHDPERFEVMLHALGDMPLEGESWGEGIRERWDAVEDAMASFRFWGSAGMPSLTDAERSWLAPLARAALSAFPADQDPAVSARIFEQALSAVVEEFTPPGYRKSWPS
jgi:hypothetical protein